MQFLVTVNDPEYGLGSGTERNLTEQIEQMVEMWGKTPGLVASIETHEEDVYGSEPTPTCDICGKPDGAGVPDWNGETGNHLSCEARPLDEQVDIRMYGSVQDRSGY